MGNPTGFMHIQRRLPASAAVQERLQHYREFVEPYSKQDASQQASRCMDCGVPFCHQGCPLGNVIPEFNDAVYRNDWEAAYHILSATNNFPEFTGRICPAPCESACVLGINESPVAIEAIEKQIIEHAFTNGYVQPKIPLVRTGKKIAIVGSGPAGLAAAAELNYAGHTVTVFERDEEPGGLLRYGIPDFKLEKSIVDRRLSLMEEEGIIFRCHANVGVNISIEELLREFNAIILTGGSTTPRNLFIPGRQYDGIHFAMDFLKQNNKKVAGKTFTGDGSIESNMLGFEVNAYGKHVVVIGGGDTGSDCIGTCNRQGAASVVQLELLPQPPAVRTSSTPWPGHPMLLKTTSSHEEGAERKWSIATKEFIGDESGKLKAIRLVRIEWNGFSIGQPPSFIEVEGSEFELQCDMVLLAMGFVHPQQVGFVNELDLALDSRGNILANDKDFKTSIPRIFAAGDMRRGQSLVVWAIAEGRAVAKAVNVTLS